VQAGRKDNGQPTIPVFFQKMGKVPNLLCLRVDSNCRKI
jgi:hypothetical protein